MTSQLQDLYLILKKSHTNNYIGENVSQLEHFVLAAQLAEKEYPHDYELVVAAFLHDIGHQLWDRHNQLISPDGTFLGLHSHETIGAQWLHQMGFSERICALVRNHVKAKKYLAYKIPDYIQTLSLASQQTLVLQKGMMTAEEAFNFEMDPYFDDSLLIRRYDDSAKDASQLSRPLDLALDHYFDLSIQTLSKKLIIKDY